MVELERCFKYYICRLSRRTVQSMQNISHFTIIQVWISRWEYQHLWISIRINSLVVAVPNIIIFHRLKRLSLVINISDVFLKSLVSKSCARDLFSITAMMFVVSGIDIVNWYILSQEVVGTRRWKNIQNHIRIT